jgi:polyisoprenoid-binding protein YceI
MNPSNWRETKTRIMSQAPIDLSLRKNEFFAAQNRWWRALAKLRLQSGAMMLLAVLSMSVLLRPQAADTSSHRSIDTERSVLTVHVYKAGMFSAFGHDHQIRASIQKGAFDEDKARVDFVVDSRTLRVLDSDVSDKDRAQIQATMLGPKVLDSDRFPEIRFRSTEVTRVSEGKWTVHGDLALHGKTRPVQIDVERQAGRYRGSARLRQKEFGITPVTAAGGTVKVKDEVRVEFEVVGK